MPASAASSSSVFFGACTTPASAGSVECHVDSASCSAAPGTPTGTDFQTGLSAGKVCRASDIRVGRCVGSSTLGLCTPGGCGSGTGAKDPDCDLLKHGGDDTLTVYGACQERFSNIITGCFYGASDCLDSNGDGVNDANPSERYLEPDVLFSLLAQPEESGVTFSGELFCDCSDTRVGACVRKAANGIPGIAGTDVASLYCAVKPTACGPGEIFYNARRLMQLPGLLQCKLCDVNDLTDASRIATKNFFDAKKAELLAKNKSSSSSSPSEDSSSSDDGNNQTPLIVGAVGGGVLGVALIVFLVWFGRRLCCSGGAAEPKDLQLREESKIPEILQEPESESSLPVENAEAA